MSTARTIGSRQGRKQREAVTNSNIAFVCIPIMFHKLDFVPTADKGARCTKGRL